MLEEAISLATQTRSNAYCKYSQYAVGAAIEFEANGERHLVGGCNVENISFGLCQCAERSAICTAVALYGTVLIHRVVVATQDGGTPCGACRQVISEFAADDCQVVCIAQNGEQSSYSFDQLFPNSFTTDQLSRTETLSKTVKR